jgi:hypothetical protein
MTQVDNTGVHATHCCPAHGCKYGDPDCPVVAGVVQPVYTCEDCESDIDYLHKLLSETESEVLRKTLKRLSQNRKELLKDIIDAN